MQGITFHGPHDFRFESVEDPMPQAATDAVVRVTRTTICGSDLHLWHGSLPAVDRGFTVGHEFVGVVDEVGSAVASVRVGDRVLVSCTIGCGSCSRCRRGLYSGCSITTAGGTQSNILGFSAAFPGGQAERARIPFADTNVFRIPDEVSDDQALFLTDILPTAYMATEFAEVQAGDCVVVLGCGPVGSLAQRCARIRGAAQVIAVDPDEARRAHAAGIGCEVIDPEREDLAARVVELTGGEGADSVIEAVGRPELVASAVLLLRPGGIIAVAGVIMTPVEIPWALVMLKNLSLRAGLVNPQQNVHRLLALIEAGRLDPTELITHRMPLSDAIAGYELFAERRDGVLKIVLETESAGG
jgi:2-desacetyl-2-hydroxyethyl bacteriochlorophyllide A dehydrogenase